MPDGKYRPAPDTDDELLPVVDMDDRQVGTATRREIHEKELVHRAVHVILSDGMGSFLIARRSDRKDRFPGWWDVSVGGHVGVGESYLECARREMREELGVDGPVPHLTAMLPPTPTNGWEHVHVFFAVVDPARVVRNEAEIADMRWVSLADYRKHADPGAPVDSPWRMTPASHESILAWIEIGTPGLFQAY